jgi:hypothetical protein
MASSNGRVTNVGLTARAALSPVCACALITLGVLACRGTIPVTPGDPSACPALLLDFLRQPTGALAVHWLTPDAARTGRLWGTVNRDGTERPHNSETASPVPANTHGIAFDMFAHVEDEFGFDDPASIGVAYILEYTLPAPNCDMDASWDTELSITLPNGFCIASEGTPGQCSGGGRGSGFFDLISIQDPSGTMSVSGAGRPALENAIEAALGTVNERARILVTANTTSRLRKAASFSGRFTVGQGVRAKVYVGVGTLVMKAPHGWACIRDCISMPDRLVDHAVFLVEGGDDGVIGVGMTPRQ